MKRARSLLMFVSVAVILLVVTLLSPRTQFLMGGALVNEYPGDGWKWWALASVAAVAAAAVAAVVYLVVRRRRTPV